MARGLLASSTMTRERRMTLLAIGLLTLNAGWIDALAFQALGRVFASFLTGNFVFIGLSAAQGDGWLFLRAVVAIAASFGGAVVGSRYLDGAGEPAETRGVHVLAFEEAVLVAFIVVWGIAGHPGRSIAVQLALLALAAVSMGLQGALVQRFNVPGAVANALTGTVLLIGSHVGRRQAAPRDSGPSADWFLASLPLLYIASAIAVVLLMPSGLAPIVPLLLVALAIAVLASKAGAFVTTEA